MDARMTSKDGFETWLVARYGEHDGPVGRTARRIARKSRRSAKRQEVKKAA